jgi:hypothetical protein
MKRLLFCLALASASVAFPQQYSNNARFGGVYRVDQFTGVTLDAKLSACINGMGAQGGICDARSFGASTLAANITVAAANVHVLLPCATITTAYQFIVSAGVRNTYLEGCAFQGGSNASGTQGGTVWIYTGSAAAFQVGDTTYAQDTKGFRIENVNLNTASAGTSAKGFAFYRTQEISARDLYLNGNQLTGQTGIYLDGTGDYTGGTFDSDTMNGFGAGVTMTGHVSGSVVDDYSNASTFTRLHIACPTSSGSPVAGTYGVNLLGGDGNTWDGGDIEGCSTMFHFGASAVNNTVNGLRNENSTIQYQADAGSTFNAVFTGGTFFTGQLVDNGSRNSFWDAFHRTANGMNGDWYASQQDATVTNHLRLGIGTGTVRGLQWESSVDQGTTGNVNNWEWGISDGAAGSNNWFFQDLVNNTLRLIMTQNNAAGGNAQTAINAAGTGNVCLQCSSHSGTGGVIIDSGGASPTQVAGFDNAGNLSLLGQLNFYSGSIETWEWECNSTAVCQLRNANATTPMSPFIAYTNGSTEIDSQGSSPVVINNHSTGGTGGFVVYEGGANYNTPAFTVDGSGNATAGKNSTVTNHLNQAATGAFSGTCTMASSTTCTVAMGHSWNSTPDCHANPQGSTPYYAAYSVSSNNVTLTANTSNSATWAVTCIGNPN